jgi:hypothetical protein
VENFWRVGKWNYVFFLGGCRGVFGFFLIRELGVGEEVGDRGGW